MSTEEHGNGHLARWTRADVARHLAVSITTVRRMEGVALHPHVDDTGVRWFDPVEIKAQRGERIGRPTRARQSAGEIAARVFELFKRGAELREVVITARVEPTLVRTLYSEWLVTLREGELAKRAALQRAEDERERERQEEDMRKFHRSLGRDGWRATLEP